MGQAGEALLFLLPTELEYLPLLATHGVKVARLPLDPILASLRDCTAAMVSITELSTHVDRNTWLPNSKHMDRVLVSGGSFHSASIVSDTSKATNGLLISTFNTAARESHYVMAAEHSVERRTRFDVPVSCRSACMLIVVLS